MADDKLLADAKKNSPDKEPPSPPPPAPRAPKHPQNANEKRTANLNRELRLRLDDLSAQQASGKLDELTESELHGIIARLQKNRDDLSASLEPIPTEDPLMMQAFRLQEEAAATSTRLESKERALTGRAQAGADQATGDKDQIFQAAAAKGPLGYCEGEGRADRDHCALTDGLRLKYQRKITNVVTFTHANWTAAINAKLVEELIAKEKIPFEQKLGDLLLGLLFQGFGAAAKHAVASGTNKVVKGLTTETEGNFPGVKDVVAPDPDAVALGKGALDFGAKQGLEALEKAGTGHKSAKQVSDEAQVAAPADRKAFLQVMKSAPTTWGESILRNLDQLYDEDLAALFLSLPDTAPTQTEFEERIESLLKRFEAQVLAVNDSVHPIAVIGPHGRVRHALVTAETKADPSLHGEWRNEMVATGKTRFLGWVDADMTQMAYAHNTTQNTPSMPHSFDDAAYWGDDSLVTLAHAEPETREVGPLMGHRASS